MTLEALVRDYCAIVLGDMKADQYVRVARTMRVVLEELHLLAIPFIQTKELTITDALVAVVPPDCVKPLQIGTLNSDGRIQIFGHDHRIRRTATNDIDNPVDCDNPDYDQTLTSTVPAPTDGIVFFNFNGRSGYIGELYGLRRRAFANGTWRWNQAEGVIEFGSGSLIWAGQTVIMEYKSTFGEDIHRLVPKQWQNTINARTSQLLNSNSNPNKAEMQFRQFLREYQTVKRHMQNVPLAELQAHIEEARYSAPKW